MKIGKYVTNVGIISQLAGAYGVSKQTKKMPADWRRYVVWAVWGLGLVLAISSVINDDSEFE